MEPFQELLLGMLDFNLRNQSWLVRVQEFGTAGPLSDWKWHNDEGIGVSIDHSVQKGHVNWCWIDLGVAARFLRHPLSLILKKRGLIDYRSQGNLDRPGRLE